MNDPARLVAQYINSTDKHIFLTGRAGTGKSTFLNYIVNHTYKSTIVAAPTGIAAINVGGVTLHSLFQLPFGTFIPERISVPDKDIQINTPQTLFTKSKFNASKRALIAQIELLIIDEVSMLRADLLDCIDHTLRHIRGKKNSPFGGVQILFVGDLMQLQPVVKRAERTILEQFYPSNYFFEAKALKEATPILVEFTKIYRQSDDQFVRILNRFRENKQTPGDIRYLNGYFDPQYDTLVQNGHIYLTTHNRKTDEINREMLAEISSEPISFDATITGDFPEVAFPTVPTLILKKDAQIMFVKNDPSGKGRFFNGKIGRISYLDKTSLLIRFEDGEEVEVDSYIWKNKRYKVNEETNDIEEDIIGTFEQYPIRLAWAITVHKSQGLTFEKAVLDLESTFTPGQVYVALSRLTSLNGLILSSPIPESQFKFDQTVESFTSTKKTVEELSNNLFFHQRDFFHRYATEAFDFSSLMVETTNLIKKNGKSMDASRTEKLISEITSLKDISIRFRNQLSGILSNEDCYLPPLNDRIGKASSYFSEIIQQISNQLKEQVSSNKKASKDTLKLYKELEQHFLDKHKKIAKIKVLVNATLENRQK